MPKQVPQGESF
jgi:hypothetical protein